MLTKAERRAEQRSTEQQERMSRLFNAAQRRLAGARELRDERLAASALILYREAIALLTTADLVASGAPPSEDVLDAPAAWSSLRPRLEPDAPDRPDVSVEALREWLAGPNVLTVDRAAKSDPQGAREGAEALASWLAARIDPRSRREIRIQRGVRLGSLAFALLVLLLGAVVAAVSPNNVARGRRVTVSSQQPGSPPPSQVVNGEVEGTYGMLTTKENEPWVEVDLGASYALSEVVVHNRRDKHRQTTALLLELATDDGAYREVGRHEGQLDANQAWRITLGGEVARYLRVVAPQTTQLGLAEIEAYGARP